MRFLTGARYQLERRAGFMEILSVISCNALKLGISSEQDAKPAAWLRLTHYKDCAIIDIKV
jgi:hypothetical protein